MNAQEMRISDVIYSFYPNEYVFLFKLVKKPSLENIE